MLVLPLPLGRDMRIITGFSATVIMREFLGDRTIEAELDSPLQDNDMTAWFVALDGRTVQGFCAAETLGLREVLFRSDYVFPDCRRKGVYRNLFVERMDGFGPRMGLTAYASDESLGRFIQYGFDIKVLGTSPAGVNWAKVRRKGVA